MSSPLRLLPPVCCSLGRLVHQGKNVRTQRDPVTARILDEVNRATPEEANAYLVGALHDGTFNRLHRTLRIAQADE